MTDEPKMSLGRREDGSIVHISELDEEQRGLDCRCTCSACGCRLVAKLGAVRQRHFAHHMEQGCVSGDESALHLFAKEIFQSDSQFMVPKAEISWRDARTTIRDAGYFIYTDALPEQVRGEIVPDITLSRGTDSPMLVEIKVTHAVDGAKFAKLEMIGLPCVEIDLGETYRRLGAGVFDREGIKRMIIHGVGDEKKWICIPNRKEFEEELKERVRLAEEARRAEEEKAREKARAFQEQKRLEEETRRRKRKIRLDDLLSPHKIAADGKRKEAELAGHPLWGHNSRALRIELDNIPYYLNIPIDGEYLFTCHRVIWQSTIYRSWVFNKAEPGRTKGILVEFVIENLQMNHLLEPELYWAFRDRPGVPSPAHVVGAYLRHLEMLEFVSKVQGHESFPLWWGFECLVSRVVPLPPKFNNPRYRPLEDGILDTATGEIIDSNASNS